MLKKAFIWMIIFVIFKSPASEAASSAIQLALNWKPEPEFGGFYQAQKDGEFKKRKINLEIIEGGSGTPVIQLVASGKVPFGIVSADEVLLSRANGSDVIPLFAVYQTNPQGIMVHQSRDLKSLEEVFKNEGLLAWQGSLPYALYLQKKYAPFKVKTVPYAGGVTLFLNDSQLAQQCFITSEPLVAEKNNKPVKTFLVAESGYNPYTALVVTTASYRQKNPELVKNLLQAISVGWKNYLQDPKATNLLMHQLNPSLDLETFAKSAQAQKPLIQTPETEKNGLGSMTEERWKILLTQLQDLKIIKKEVSLSDLLKSITH